MNYNIRRKRKEDIEQIQKVITIAWQETYKGIVDDDFLDNLPKTEEERIKKSQETFDEKDNNQFVLEVDNKIVGFINVGKENTIGEIYAIYILKQYKGNGFGKKLIETGIKELKKLGCTEMIIGCLQGNPSNEFYKHLGGNIIKTRIFKLPNQELLENVYHFII